MIYPTIKQEITTSGYVAVDLPDNIGCKAFSLWTEDQSDYYISSLSDGSDAILMPNGFPLGISIGHSKGETLCYAKGSATSNLVGLIVR